MKRILTALFFSVLIFVGLLSFNDESVNAKGSYVDNFDTDVYIQTDGSAKIKQSIRFYVSGKQNQFSFT
ncbi:hypothetical protein [Companilactobacillus furfuricola]|uniref:hypothetical protein n=1 Tax=Companilactobacillus furfuricola TaxID=1462575 RepID=UPI000F771060|nr:hypothetical protein [Companilactobacillus furfuricola]